MSTPTDPIDLRHLAQSVIELLDMQQAYFKARGRGLPAQAELEASKQAERLMRRRCRKILDADPAPAPSLFDEVPQ